MFDGVTYFQNLAQQNKLSKANSFFPCTVSGIDHLQEVANEFMRRDALFAVDDTNDGLTEQDGSGGYFKHRTFTVFLLKRFKPDDMKSREASLQVCRELFRQIHSRLIKEVSRLSNDLVFINTSSILSREIPNYFLDSFTGLYFMVDFKEPVDLCYNASEWQ